MRSPIPPLITRTPISTANMQNLRRRRATAESPQPTTPLLRLLDGCRTPSSLPSLRPLHSKILTQPHLSTDPSISIKLMRAYAACGDPLLARRVFDGAHDKNVVFFNVMIRSYANNRLYSDALCLFSEMLSTAVKPDNYTYPCSLKACSGAGDLSAGVQIHGAVSKLGLDSNLFVGNALITMYCKCGSLLCASRVFDAMPYRDVVSWNAIVAGYSQRGKFSRAIEVCKKMVELGGPSPDAGTMASVLPALSSTEPANVDFVREMFDQMNDRNLISWNAMIAIYANNSMPAKAVELFQRMEMEGIEPDAVTLASVLPACGAISALSLGNQIHVYIERKGLCPNLVLENALMDMYANCGCLQEARRVFDKMEGKDVVSWTSIISAYGLYGMGRDAIIFFEQMRESGLQPDHVAFVAILSACTYAGLLDEGNHYFNCMTDQYHMAPRIEHFACMVDLFGRAGRVDEAYDFIRRMPVEPNERVWGTLLAACRVQSNMPVGLIAADRLFKLAPEESGYYVLLSNIYARAGRWEDVTAVRNTMVSKGIKKQPGHSRVELGNKVYVFHIGDSSHPRSKEIYAELDTLMGKIKEAGYIAETMGALHDVEEEDKEGHLMVHSEKLAIAFALINTLPGTPIRVTMNLRMCGDCHVAAKLISSIRGREIVIRDTNRFHHFENGVCTCGDYW